MYNDRPNLGQVLKQFIMKLILIIIFVLLLVWLVPWPSMDSYMDALNPLKDQIFNSNVQTMKEAGITYFTTERLPQNVGDKTTLTLQKMLDMKLLLPFTDRNGKSCDVTKSYVSLEKKETEYLMKVNLKCGEEEDYILVHLGCYSYCNSAICERQPNKVEKSSTVPKKVVQDNIAPKPTTKPTVVPTSNPTPTVVKYTCKFINGQYWGKNSTVVSQSTYEDECIPKPEPTPTKEKEYEYKKETSTYYAKQYSNWSNWQEYVQQNGQNVAYGKSATKEVEDLGYKYVKTKTQDAVIETVVTPVSYQAQIGTAKYNVCAEREYVIEKTYTTTITKTEYKVNYTGGYQLVQVSGGYHETGNYWSGFNVPDSTATVKWVPAGMNFNQCTDCINHPFLVWKEYKRDAGATYVLNSDPLTTTTNGGAIEDTSVTEKILSSGCSRVEEREIPVYINRIDTQMKSFVKEPAKDIYEWVHFYRVRTRELLSDEHTDIKIDYKWSDYGNTTLLNAGYKYTGHTREK